jgi:hypothetical protein
MSPVSPNATLEDFEKQFGMMFTNINSSEHPFSKRRVLRRKKVFQELKFNSCRHGYFDEVP